MPQAITVRYKQAPLGTRQEDDTRVRVRVGPVTKLLTVTHELQAAEFDSRSA